MTRTLNIAALLLIAACGKSDQFFAHGYWWEPAPEILVCSEEETMWFQSITTEVLRICGEGKIGCTINAVCVVLSMYDRETSMFVIQPPADESHYKHEMRHRTLALRHPV